VLDPVSPEPLRPTTADVRFKQVSYAHAGAPPLFTGLDLTVPSGTRIGLVGRSGGGKSTLIRLLLRLMDIDDGCILVGGQDISRLRQADLRSLIAYVPQDPAMFHRTLRDNIAFARPDASDAEIHRAAQAAHVTEFAEVLPDGFDTMVGDGRTALVVAHRLSTVVRMDQLIVLDRGRIIEQGNHDELLQMRGTYARLWRHQSDGFLDDGGTSPSGEGEQQHQRSSVF
jgi:ATP-binding cassette, subfamily B, bacterial